MLATKPTDPDDENGDEGVDEEEVAHWGMEIGYWNVECG
jgi:hypothetical protein